jgi:hypothetical protein
VTIKIWLENAIQDAERRGLPALRPLLEALARSTSGLRTADWNFDATGDSDRVAHGTELSAGASAKVDPSTEAPEKAPAKVDPSTEASAKVDAR